MRSGRLTSLRTSRSTSLSPVKLTGYWSSLRLVTGALRSRLLRQRADAWSGLTLLRRCSHRRESARLTRESNSTYAKETSGSSNRGASGDDYCPGRSLLHLPTWADRRRCFERVAASLRPDGRFAWNAFAFDHQTASAIDGQHADTPLPHTIHYNVSDNRVDIALDDGGTGSLWWATKNEWLGLLDVAGLRLEALYGGFAGEPLDDNSQEYVFVARR
jgi:hypothetical protein